MAEISTDFRNMVGSKKCAVSPPRIVSLEITDESPVGASKSNFEGFFCNDLVSRNGINIKGSHNLSCGSDKQTDKNSLIHSQSYLSASTSDNFRNDQISSVNDSNVEVNLFDFLNSAKSEKAAQSGVIDFNPKKITADGKMKIISNFEVSDGLSDLLSSIPREISTEDEVDATKYCQKKNTQNCDLHFPDFDFAKNECEDSLSGKSSKSSIQVEYNLSDLLSSIDIDDSNTDKIGNFNSTSKCNTKSEKGPCLADLSDILSSVSHEASNGYKIGNCNSSNLFHSKVFETENESYLSDLLSSIDVRKPVSNSIALNTGSSKSVIKNADSTTDLFDDLAFDIVSCSSNNSCASSFSETENNIPKGMLASNNLRTDKVFDSDSGFSSFNSMHKEFSFFDYSSDNKLSFDKLLSHKSDASASSKHHDSENGKSSSEEMSMSDLMNIVSPEFKNPVLSTLNKAEKLEMSKSKETSNMLDLFQSLNSEPKNSSSRHQNNNLVKYDEKVMNFDCVDRGISDNVLIGMEIDVESCTSEGKDGVCLEKSDNSVDEEKVTSDDEQIDLRACIKSSVPSHQFTTTSPIKQHKNTEDDSTEYFSPVKNPLYRVDNSPSNVCRPSPFEFNDTVPRKKSRINSKQTLFSKALSCKPKKDLSLLQKVASIKNELLSDIIYRPIYIDCDVPQPIIEPVQQSDRCILSYVGRRTFGLDAPCELQ